LDALSLLRLIVLQDVCKKLGAGFGLQAMAQGDCNDFIKYYLDADLVFGLGDRGH
jgi:hypothetical protein